MRKFAKKIFRKKCPFYGQKRQKKSVFEKKDMFFKQKI